MNTSDDVAQSSRARRRPPLSKAPIWPLTPEPQKRQRPWRIGGQEFLPHAHVQARGLTSAPQRWLSTTRYALQAV